MTGHEMIFMITLFVLFIALIGAIHRYDKKDRD